MYFNRSSDYWELSNFGRFFGTFVGQSRIQSFQLGSDQRPLTKTRSFVKKISWSPRHLISRGGLDQWLPVALCLWTLWGDIGLSRWVGIVEGDVGRADRGRGRELLVGAGVQLDPRRVGQGTPSRGSRRWVSVNGSRRPSLVDDRPGVANHHFLQVPSWLLGSRGSRRQGREGRHPRQGLGSRWEQHGVRWL